MIWHKQPKTPIWIKNKKTGLYEPIPYEKMTQFTNGEWGLICHNRCMDPQMLDFITNHLDHFEYQQWYDMWLFKPQGTKISRLVMHARSAIAGGLCTCLLVSIGKIISGEYLWIILTLMVIALFTFSFRLGQRSKS